VGLQCQTLSKSVSSSFGRRDTYCHIRHFMPSLSCNIKLHCSCMFSVVWNVYSALRLHVKVSRFLFSYLLAKRGRSSECYSVGGGGVRNGIDVFVLLVQACLWRQTDVPFALHWTNAMHAVWISNSPRGLSSSNSEFLEYKFIAQDSHRSDLLWIKGSSSVCS
jgi:hypothetical protein